LYQYLQKPVKAERAMLMALDMEPENPDFIYAMADFYIKRDQADKAEIYALKLKKLAPDNQAVRNLLDAVSRLKK
jgi:predicted Zn-dependent protease